MAARLFRNQKTYPSLHAKARLTERARVPVIPPDLGGPLPKREQDALLYKAIMSNLPYYHALARYRDRRERAATGRVKREGRMWHKNLRLCFRLTESGLCLLKTGYAKKPKNPV